MVGRGIAISPSSAGCAARVWTAESTTQSASSAKSLPGNDSATPPAPASNGCSQPTKPAPKWAAPIPARPKSHNHCAEVLGLMYDQGRGGLAKDANEAVRLYRLAADQGNAFVQARLGLMYEQEGGGLAKDEKEAVRLYRLAADQGNAVAQANLGWMYEQARGGLAKDEKEAARLYRLAADQGNTFVQANL